MKGPEIFIVVKHLDNLKICFPHSFYFLSRESALDWVATKGVPDTRHTIHQLVEELHHE